MNNPNINPTIGSVVKVINPYFKNLEDEIDLQIGDEIQIILDDEEYNDGWYYGKNLRSNLVGLFPKCFTDSPDDTKDPNNSQRTASNTESSIRKESSNSNNSVFRGNDKRLFSSATNMNRSQSSFNAPSPILSQMRASSNNSVNRSFSRLNSRNVSAFSVEQENQDEMLIQQLMKLCNMDDVLDVKNIYSWAPEDIAVYFYNQKIDLDACLKFYDHKIDSKILFSLTQQDLKNELEILSFGSRFSIVKEIDALKEKAELNMDLDFSEREVKHKKSLPKKMIEYEQTNVGPSPRSSRRSSLLLPAATVLNRSSPQSANDSVILNNNMDTTNNFNKGFYSNVERTPSNNYASITRNGTQNYRSASGNMVPTLSISKRGNLDSTPVKPEIASNLNFESPRKAPLPPAAPSPIGQSLLNSPDAHFGKNNIYENSSDKVYRNVSNNNSTSNMLKKSTSFLQRNLSFRSTPSKSRTISSPVDEPNALAQPKYPNNVHSYQTPQKADHDSNLHLSPKDVGNTSEDIQPQFLDTTNEVSHDIYNGIENLSLPKNTHQKNESGGSFLDLFNKLESMNVNSAVNTPSTTSNPRFLPPTRNSTSQPNTADSAATSVYDNRSSVYDQGRQFGHTRDTSSVYVHSRNNTIGVPTTINDTYFKHNMSSSVGNEFSSVEDNSMTKFNESDETSKDDSFVDFSRDSDDFALMNNSNMPQHKPVHELNRQLSPVDNTGMTAAEKLKQFKANRSKKVMTHTRTCKDAIKTATVHGWMGKRNSKSGVRGLNTWKRRYFILTGTRLSYYADPDHDIRERGIIDITGYSVVPVNVAAESNTNERLLTFLSSTMSSKSNYFFKIVPPKPGSKKNANFTQQKTYYFSVETVEEVKMWMNSMLKATIDIDTSVPIISSCDIPTISLEEAQNMLDRAKREISMNDSQIVTPKKPEMSEEEAIIDDYVNVSQETNASKEISLDPFKA